MTHAAKTHSALAEVEALQELRAQVASVLEKIDTVAAKELERQQLLHAELVRANAVALLRKIAKQHRTSDTDRKAADALASQLERVA
jgi:hypothetical protein